MLRPLVASLAIVLAVGLLVREEGPPPSWDCGTGGVTPRPEVGGELLYTCYLPTTKTGLYLLDVGAGTVRTVVADHAWNTDPAWSPDGARIAYVSTKDGQTDLYVMQLASGAVSRLTHGGGWNGNPTWSPDGAWIMFDSARDGTSRSPHNYFRNLFVARADGSDLRRVTALPRYNGTPSWSPDGTRIAFTSDRDGEWRLYTMKVDGSEQRRLTDHVSGYPRWSRDGTRILFQGREAGAAEDDDEASVFVMRSDGSDVRRLTDADDDKPDWSASAAWIAVARTVGERRELFVLPAAGGDAIQLTADGSDKGWARWRP